jgi:hypothetical protein
MPAQDASLLRGECDLGILKRRALASYALLKLGQIARNSEKARLESLFRVKWFNSHLQSAKAAQKEQEDLIRCLPLPSQEGGELYQVGSVAQPVQIGTKTLKAIEGFEFVDPIKIAILLPETKQNAVGKKLKPSPEFAPHPPGSGRHSPDASHPPSIEGNDAVCLTQVPSPNDNCFGTI